MTKSIRTIFVPLLTVQILLKVFEFILGTLQVRMGVYQSLNEAISFMGPVLNQCIILLAPFFLFVIYKRMPRYAFTGCIFLLLLTTVLMGSFKDKLHILLPLHTTLQMLLEGILFWKLALMVTSPGQSKWMFPVFLIGGTLVEIGLHHQWLGVSVMVGAPLWVLGTLGILITISLILIANYLQHQEMKNLKISSTLLQNFAEVFTNPLCLGVFFTFLGANLIHHLLMLPFKLDFITLINVVGILMAFSCGMLLPKNFPCKKWITGGFLLWLAGCNIIAFPLLATGLGSSLKAIFFLAWPTVLLYPFIYSGYTLLPMPLRITGFTYVIILSYGLSKAALSLMAF